MAQFDFGTMDPATTSGTILAQVMNSWRDALHSAHKGPSAPTYKVAGMMWMNDTANPWVLSIYDGANWLPLLSINPTTHAITWAFMDADGTMAANSDLVTPTQKAVLTKLTAAIAAIKSTVNAYTRQQYPTAVALADLSAIDCDLHALATYTLAANGTLPAGTNHGAGKSGELIITGASTYTLSANANWKMADGSAVAFAPAAGKKTRIIWESDGTYMVIFKIIQEA